MACWHSEQPPKQCRISLIFHVRPHWANIKPRKQTQHAIQSDVCVVAEQEVSQGVDNRAVAAELLE
ncbi:hypothetical protein EYF80_029004 [Liparis tanakae]|uniref:Uncharacterized protein n=1 Tax=Liparis tanakae TaxID=230148 RepID=A0A4Z2H5J2_9TELE|nr:hypothetical protein EYF80_029004 [Liparis tanakae]